MRNRGQIIFGALLLFIGAVLLFGSIFRIDFGIICWPSLLILLGLYLLVRPTLRQSQGGINVQIFGDVRHSGEFQLQDEEIWQFIGNLRLNLAQASLPPGETTIRLYGFINDIDIYIPESIPLDVSATGFLTSAKVLGRKTDNFVVPYNYQDLGYETAEHKIHLETIGFIIDLKIARP
jgi:predicted membrane protein